MAQQTLKLRRSSVPSKVPTTSSLDFGELAINTYDGKVYLKKSGSANEQVIAVGSNLGKVDRIFYVTEQGSDTNDGKTLETSFRTIKKATIAASASIAENPGLPVYRVSINVKSGYYTEEAPVIVPSNTSILGDDLRTVVVKPTSATSGSNLFLMNNGTYAFGLRLEGCKIDNLEDPRNGFFFAFAPSASIITSPYIQNCSAIHTPFDKFYVPLDSGSGNPLVGNGPGGMIVDDSALDGSSPLKSMVTDAYTQVTFNGIGICLRGGAYAQLVSFFTNFCRVGCFAIDGAQASLLNSNTSFGDFGLRSSGSRILVNPDLSIISQSVDTVGSALLLSNKNSIRNYMISKLAVSGAFAPTYEISGSNYASTIRDSGLLIDALSDDLLSSGSARIFQFAASLFKAQDTSAGKIFTLPPPSGSSFTKGAITVYPLISNSTGSLSGDFIKSYQYIREFIIDDPSGSFTSMTAAGKLKVSQSIQVPMDTIQKVVVENSGSNLLEEFGSLLSSTSHDFAYAGSGVNFLGLPNNQRGIGKTNLNIRVKEEAGGRVYYTAGDEFGDFYSGNDFIIRQETGTIEGRTFTKAISAKIVPINLALEG